MISFNCCQNKIKDISKIEARSISQYQSIYIIVSQRELCRVWSQKLANLVIKWIFSPRKPSLREFKQILFHCLLVWIKFSVFQVKFLLLPFYYISCEWIRVLLKKNIQIRIDPNVFCIVISKSYTLFIFLCILGRIWSLTIKIISCHYTA